MPLEDRWILSRLARATEETNRFLGEFQIDEALQTLYEFFWSEFADWYIEMAKVRLKAGDSSPLPVLSEVLQTSLRLLHPFMPFVTEAIWQHLQEGSDVLDEALIISSYPSDGGEIDAEAEKRVETLIDVVRAIRNIRAERGVDPGRYVEAYIASDGSRPALEAVAVAAGGAGPSSAAAPG